MLSLSIESLAMYFVSTDHQCSVIFVGGQSERPSTRWDYFGDFDYFGQALLNRYLDTRVLVYEYQRPAPQVALMDTINDAAKSLLYSWENYETDTVRSISSYHDNDASITRPVVFVCHSLGGIVVKQALLSSAARCDRPSLARHTFGIVYLGTPHAFNTRRCMEILRKTPNQADANIHLFKNNARRRQLKSLPERLAKISESFHHMGSLYASVHFCVDEASSCSPAIVLHEKCLWSMSSQSRISRYGEVHYIVPAHLSRRLAITSVELAISSMSQAAVRDFTHCQTSINNQRALKCMYGKQQLCNTGRWLLEDSGYRTWIDAERSYLLWLYGAAGTGKSAICSSLIDNIWNREKRSGSTFYIFFDEGLGGYDPARYLLKIITYQFREHQLPLVPDLELRSALKVLDRLSAPMTKQIFKDCLRNLFAKVNGQTRITLVVDGYHDHEWIMHTIIDEIMYANIATKRSRPLRCVLSAHSQYSGVLCRNQITQIDLDSEPRLRKDLMDFFLSKLTDFYRSTSSEKSSMILAAQQLCSRANGNFLWAALAIEDIACMAFPANLTDEIRLMPASVNEFYQRRMTAIPSSSMFMAQTVFSWLIGARRLLCLSDLREALAFATAGPSASDITLSTSAKHEMRLSEAEIYHLCGRLVIFSEHGIAMLRHQSLRKYLLSPNDSSTSGDRALQAHEMIARTCLRYLVSSVATNSSPLFHVKVPSPDQRKPQTISTFMTYALSNWSFHYRIAENYSQVLAGVLGRHLSVTLNNACGSLSMKQFQRSIQVASTTLRISAYYGYAALTKMCLETGTNPNGDGCSYCETPLSIAAAICPRNAELLKILLCKGAATTSSSGGCLDFTLFVAASEGLAEAVELNLMGGADANLADDLGQTALHIAAAQGNVQTVKLLMNYCADVNAMLSITNQTPLHLAAAHGHLDVVKYIVDGQKVSPREVNLYRSLSQQPVYRDWKENLLATDGQAQGFVWEIDARILAEQDLHELSSYATRYVNINDQTFEGLTALDIAASRGHQDIVQFLLARRATECSLESKKYTSLKAAAENGHLDTVRLLIEAETIMHPGSKVLGTIIKNADSKGHRDVANLILFHLYSSEVSGKPCYWPISVVATQSKRSMIRDVTYTNSIQRKILPFRGSEIRCR